ncbi:MAG: TIGR01777 family oxidoreductase [Ignavibacteriales bacterium]|nr:MAG: TIGR01777 family protein [Ignavibacteriaceae bacterium]MBV6444821.1 Epimerase family protein [Ignavibacteriaceae bacterium]MBW7873392.1 TIGR01777 family protein [Ignavibacteria bacterium]MCZ2142082.1 TIGR01777 family oxidoreductase [Ignavibacteriales bacterium]WKZ71719.1 MAG: TIGR01777 family oxidoreductase [Ignavibacteriaceae bacterium]
MSKKIVITGGTGLIGKSLAKKLHQRGDNPVIITRDPVQARGMAFINEFVRWDYKDPQSIAKKLEGAEAFVNLAGASVVGRWNDPYKMVILNSRVQTTDALVHAISLLEEKPKTLVSSSATGYYGNTGDEERDETASPGESFLSDVCRAWEQQAILARNHAVKVSVVRTGVVLSPDGGALPKMMAPFKYFMGGSVGSGTQWMPWIHIEDIVNLYIFLIDNPQDGIFNGVSPTPVTMDVFSFQLGKALGRPSMMKVPSFLIKLRFGEMAGTILDSQRIVPVAAEKAGFRFSFPEIDAALADLLKKR